MTSLCSFHVILYKTIGANFQQVLYSVHVPYCPLINIPLAYSVLKMGLPDGNSIDKIELSKLE